MKFATRKRAPGCILVRRVPISSLPYTREPGAPWTPIMARKRHVEQIVPLGLALSLLCENDRAHARYNNFSEPLFTEAIYEGRPTINKEFTMLREPVACSRTDLAIYMVSAPFRFALVNDYTSFRSCFLSVRGFVFFKPEPTCYTLILLRLFILSFVRNEGEASIRIRFLVIHVHVRLSSLTWLFGCLFTNEVARKRNLISYLNNC